MKNGNAWILNWYGEEKETIFAFDNIVVVASVGNSQVGQLENTFPSQFAFCVPKSAFFYVLKSKKAKLFLSLKQK